MPSCLIFEFFEKIPPPENEPPVHILEILEIKENILKSLLIYNILYF